MAPIHVDVVIATPDVEADAADAAAPADPAPTGGAEGDAAQADPATTPRSGKKEKDH